MHVECLLRSLDRARPSEPMPYFGSVGTPTPRQDSFPPTRDGGFAGWKPQISRFRKESPPRSAVFIQADESQESKPHNAKVSLGGVGARGASEKISGEPGGLQAVDGVARKLTGSREN